MEKKANENVLALLDELEGITDREKININVVDDLFFLVSILDANDKKEFIKEFASVLYERGIITRVTKYKYESGEMGPSDDKVVEAALLSRRAFNWIVSRSLAKATEALNRAKKYLDGVKIDLGIEDFADDSDE